MRITTNSSRRKHIGWMLAAAMIASSAGGLAKGATPTTQTAGNSASEKSTIANLQHQLKLLERKVSKLKGLKVKVAQLERQQRTAQNQREQAAQIRRIAQRVIRESQDLRDREVSLQVGYNNGFFIQTADKNYSLKFNGFAQFRYTFGGYTDVPRGIGSANSSGFGFRYARLRASGDLFNPRFTYVIMGDFAGASSNDGNFQLDDFYGAYRFSSLLRVKAGAFLIPFTHVEYIPNGLELPDFNPVIFAFDPQRSLGVSVYGDFIPHKVSYEFNVNDGANANDAGMPTDPSPAIGNRMGFATRAQWAGAGKLSDFNTEPDLAWSKHLAWMLGGAMAYESQDPDGEPFGQATDVNPIYGTINGSTWRFEADYLLHYRGFSLSPAVLYEHGHTGGGFDQFGYYIQGGYFLVPHKWELAASFGQLFPSGLPPATTAFEVGLNYYIIGNNVKLQAAETYVNDPFTQPDAGTYVGADNYITQIQLQVAF